MKRKKIVMAVLVITAITVLAILGVHARAGATADSIAILRTTGMTCGSCSTKITKALKSLKGVAVTEVDVDGGWVIVGYDTKKVRPEGLAEKIKGTGFYSQVYDVVTPGVFRQITGRNVGENAVQAKGCCGGKGGGCGGNKS